jgi:hypothetical protein
MKWRPAGPQLPAQAVGPPIKWGFRARRRRHPHGAMDALDLAPIDGVGDAVRRVADDPIAPLAFRPPVYSSRNLFLGYVSQETDRKKMPCRTRRPTPVGVNF